MTSAADNNTTASTDLDQFRLAYRAFLEANPLPNWRERARSSEAEFGQVQRDWIAILNRGGYAAPKWPVEHGGLKASVAQQLVMNEENQRADCPSQKLFEIALNHTGATVLNHGTEDQRAHLPRILDGTAIWCQGFSEPNAGSDLANLQTRAIRDGDNYVVTGQKVWSSWAHHADWCLLLVRTDQEVAKHKGISYLLVDLSSPGVTVRPLVQLTGNPEFCEIYFDDVLVPAANLVGREGDGWRISQTTLQTERGAFLLDRGRALERRFANIVANLPDVAESGAPLTPDTALVNDLATDYAEMRILLELCQRVLDKEKAFGSAGWEPSIAKLFEADLTLRIGEHSLASVGLLGQTDCGQPGATAAGETPWVLDHLNAFGLKIAGGTSQIQRNILGERVLGLPREPRPKERT